MVFANRNEAGVRLAAKLKHYKGEDVVVFALPRGGIPVAAPVASALDAPLDLVLVRKLGTPRQPELAMGAIADAGEPVIVRNDDVISDGADQRNRVRRRLPARARGDRAATAPLSRLAAAQRIRRVASPSSSTMGSRQGRRRARRCGRSAPSCPKKLVLATPVAPPDALDLLRPEADEIVCLETPAKFWAIGYFYRDFHQLEDDEVIAILDRFRTGGEKAT